MTNLARNPRPETVPVSSTPSRGRSAAIVVTALVLVVLVTAGTAEGLVRLFVPVGYWRLNDGRALWRPDARLGWDMKANAEVRIRGTIPPYAWTVRTNGDGLFPPTATRERRPGVARILIFGDSIVAGIGVPPPDRVSAQLEAILRARGLSVEVINAGVEGYATDQALLRMEKLLPLYRPDIVLVGICPNDFFANQQQFSSGVPKPSFWRRADGSYELLPPRPLPADFEPYAVGLHRWISYSAAFQILRPFLLGLKQRLHRQQDTPVPPDELVYFRPEVAEQRDWVLFRELLGRMRREVESNGGRLSAYLHPSAGEVWPPYIERVQKALGFTAADYDRFAMERRVTRETGAAGVPFTPLIGYFLAREAEGPFHLLPIDPHSNSVGYRLIAQALADRLLGDAASPLTKTAR